MARITKAELQQINARLAAENEALRAQLSSLQGDIDNGLLVRADAQRSEPRAQPARQPNTVHAELKRVALKFRCVTRVDPETGGIELHSKNLGRWITVEEAENLMALHKRGARA